jgi:hypothetical protein
MHTHTHTHVSLSLSLSLSLCLDVMLGFQRRGADFTCTLLRGSSDRLHSRAESGRSTPQAETGASLGRRSLAGVVRARSLFLFLSFSLSLFLSHSLSHTQVDMKRQLEQARQALMLHSRPSSASAMAHELHGPQTSMAATSHSSFANEVGQILTKSVSWNIFHKKSLFIDF